ncbi:MAG: hypothetical protein CBD16_08410 [Betaproteobacteria bacterium TMED156]|nr:MAG: hypothetical protein CBD16_08410 [Betaproteobacteria bacterium TMED156]
MKQNQSIKFPNKLSGGVFFKTTAIEICRLNLWSSMPSRILIQVGKTQVKTANELLEFACRIDWQEWFNPSNSFKVDVNSSGRMPESISANFAALKFKDGICDYFRKKFYGIRPNVDKKTPDIRIWLHFVNSLVTVSIDSSGEPLFKRGWRKSRGIAPIRENLVSALIAMSKWDHKLPLLDPMCGSGTFVIEAVKKATGIPANYLPENQRKFSCELFSNDSPFSNVNWQILREEALEAWVNSEKKSKNLPFLTGIDADINMIQNAELNAKLALPKKISNMISWEVGEFAVNNYINRQIPSKGVILTNPPFGLRIELDDDLKTKLIQQMGSVLKKNFSGWTAWILTNEKNFSSKIRLKPNNKFSVFNGDISCIWLSFEIVKGSIKKND